VSAARPREGAVHRSPQDENITAGKEERTRLAQVEDLLALEDRLLRERQFRQWLALFTHDGAYWIPVSPAQTNALLAPSHIYEVRPALDARVERLYDARVLPQLPLSRVSRMRGRPWITASQPDAMEIMSPFQIVEARHIPDDQEEFRIFAGECVYHLVSDIDAPCGWRIRLKRVDLINSESAFFGVSILI